MSLQPIDKGAPLPIAEGKQPNELLLPDLWFLVLSYIHPIKAYRHFSSYGQVCKTFFNQCVNTAKQNPAFREWLLFSNLRNYKITSSTTLCTVPANIPPWFICEDNHKNYYFSLNFKTLLIFSLKEKKFTLLDVPGILTCLPIENGFIVVSRNQIVIWNYDKGTTKWVRSYEPPLLDTRKQSIHLATLKDGLLLLKTEAYAYTLDVYQENPEFKIFDQKGEYSEYHQVGERSFVKQSGGKILEITVSADREIVSVDPKLSKVTDMIGNPFYLICRSNVDGHVDLQTADLHAIDKKEVIHIKKVLTDSMIHSHFFRDIYYFSAPRFAGIEPFYHMNCGQTEFDPNGLLQKADLKGSFFSLWGDVQEKKVTLGVLRLDNTTHEFVFTECNLEKSPEPTLLENIQAPKKSFLTLNKVILVAGIIFSIILATATFFMLKGRPLPWRITLSALTLVSPILLALSIIFARKIMCPA